MDDLGGTTILGNTHILYKKNIGDTFFKVTDFELYKHCKALNTNLNTNLISKVLRVQLPICPVNVTVTLPFYNFTVDSKGTSDGLRNGAFKSVNLQRRVDGLGARAGAT